MANKNFIVKNGLEVGGQEVVSSLGVVTSAALGGQTLSTTDSPTFADLTLTGNLNLTGDINSYNVTDLDVTDQTITLGAGQLEALSGGSGIIVDGSNASILWDETNDEWDFNKAINVTGNITAQSGGLIVGTSDTTGGVITVYGNGTGNNEGGEIQLKMAADHDSTYDHYRLDVVNDNFRIGRAGTTDLTINSLGNATFGGTISSGRITTSDGIADTGQAGSATIFNESGSTADFRIESDAKPYMFFLDGGLNRIGINTGTPSHTLHILNEVSSDTIDENNGLVKMQSSGGNGMIFGTIASSPFTSYIQSAYVADTSIAQYGLALNPLGGNVGIGTDNPSALLHLKDNFSNGVAITLDRTESGIVDNLFYIGVTSSVSAANDRMWFGTSTTDLTITDDGNVGIGTDSPVAELNVNGSIVIDDGERSNPTGGPSLVIDYQTLSDIQGRIRSRDWDGATWKNFTIEADDINLLPAGNVGIGTSSPAQKLHVTGNIYAGAGNYFTDSTSGYFFGGSGSFTNGVYGVGTNNMAFNVNGLEKMRLFNNGRVKIGGSFNGCNAGLHVANADIRCTAPAIANDANSISMSYESVGGVIAVRGPSTSTRGTLSLSVNQSNGGGGRVGFKIDNLGLIYAEYMGSGGATTDVNYNTSTGEIYQVTSSQRYKENISEYTDSILEKVNNLTVKNFDYKESGYTNQIGLIAEEVEEQIPYLVNKKEIEGYDEPQPDSVKYSQLSVFLLKAIQEQQTIIESLQSRLDEAGL